MNKKELIARVQRHMGIGCTRQTATATVDAVLTSIVKLSAQGTLRLHNFGSFSQKTRPARQGHHPLSGEPLSIPASQGLHFSASAKLLRRFQ